MIGYLEGTLLELLPGSIILRTPGGVGYQLFVPAGALAGLSRGDETRFFVTTIVREGELSLYGFTSLQGKTLFELLLKVNGVGPKAATSLLSAMSPSELAVAVAQENVAALSSAPGIGKKTAARLCLELKDKLTRLEGLEGAPSPAGGRADLVSALTNLGFPEKDVFSVLGKLPSSATEFSDALKQALSLLSHR